jgi:hypothetical protein
MTLPSGQNAKFSGRGDPRHERRRRDERAHQSVDGPEHGPVGHVHREAGGGGSGPAGHELAEQLHVVVLRSEDALVERLLAGPHRGRGGAGYRAVQRSSQLHRQQRNEPGGGG